MKFTFAIRPRTAVGLLALLAIAGSVAATEKTEGLTIGEIGERLQVRLFVSSEKFMQSRLLIVVDCESCRNAQLCSS